MEESAISPYSGDMVAFGNAQRVAASLAKSSLVPVAYQGQNGLANCIVALEIASRMRMSPLLVMQNLDVIHGRASWKSSFLIGLINSCGKFSPLRFQYSGEGDDRSCYATANDKATGEVIDGPACTIKMAKAQGWYGRSGSKWPDMPDLMLSYRAAAFWSRLHAPELQMGYQTEEEAIDIEPVTVTNEPPHRLPADSGTDSLDPANADATGGSGSSGSAVSTPSPTVEANDQPNPSTAADAPVAADRGRDSGPSDTAKPAAVQPADSSEPPADLPSIKETIDQFKVINKASPERAAKIYGHLLYQFELPAGTPISKAVTGPEHIQFLQEQFRVEQ